MSYTNPTTEEVLIRRAQLAPFDFINENVSLALFSCILLEQNHYPDRYLDLGSGTGAMVNLARKLGIDAWGVDVINGPEEWFIHHDLNEHLLLPMAFDLITCLEVAEHLNPSSSWILVDTIARHLPIGGRLVFSSAPPGQSGDHHMNNQHPWYWREKFYDEGISYRPDLTMQLSHIWSWIAGPMMWLGSNVQVYDR